MQIIGHAMEALMVGFSFETCFLDPLVVMPRKARIVCFAICLAVLAVTFWMFYAQPVV